MKLSSKILKLGMLMLLVTVILAGCASASSAHLGKWEVYEGDDDNLEFTEEKMYSSNGFSYPYEIDGEKLNVQMASITRTYGLSVTGNRMELHDEYTGITSKYIREGSFVHDAEAYKSLVGSWGIDDEVIFTFTENQELLSPGDDQAMNIEVEDGLIRSFKGNDVMYVPYVINGEKLKLTITGDEVEAVKFTQEYLDEIAKKKEEEKKAEEARLAEEAAKQIVLDVQVDDFYGAENYLFVDVSVTNNMTKDAMFGDNQIFLITENGDEIGQNTDDSSFTKVKAGETQRACIGFTLETDADWENSSKAKYIVYMDENFEMPIGIATVDGSQLKDELKVENLQAQASGEAIATTEETTKEENATTIDSGLVLSQVEVYKDGLMHVTGLVNNPTGKDVEYVRVKFEVYDANGYTIDTVQDYSEIVRAGATWKFDAGTFKTDAEEFKLIEFTSN